MAVESVLEASRNAMNYERLRMDAASRNIAGANVPVAPGKSPTLWRVDGAGGADFADALGGSPALGEADAAVREVYDPGHPMASADGMVRYPSVDMVQEMTTLMTASRGYEANVRSFNFLRNMLLRAIEIGAK
ncbi:MAG: flagellar basal body rod protein FlgC [Pseudomonadota bacterium]